MNDNPLRASQRPRARSLTSLLFCSLTVAAFSCADSDTNDVDVADEEGWTRDEPSEPSAPAPLDGQDSTFEGPISDLPVADATASGSINGFASLSGSGVNTTTGGGNQTATRVTTCNDLKAALGDSKPRVIELPAGGVIDCRTSPRTQVACVIPCGSSDPNKNSYRLTVPGQTCKDLNSNRQTNRTRNEIRIDVKSNKTLLGAGGSVRGATLNLSNSSNIIIQNLTIEEINPGLIEAGDAITLENSHHIWIDHCRFRNISDGYIDMKKSSNVTLSWNHFYGVNSAVCGNQHHYVMLVGDTTATLHHNFFDRTSGRNPKLDGASKAHIYNNYYKNITYFAIGTNGSAQAKVEANVFENARRPHWKQGGKIEATGNRYLGTYADTKEGKDSGDKVFGVSYKYTAESAANLSGVISSGVGPKK